MATAGNSMKMASYLHEIALYLVKIAAYLHEIGNLEIMGSVLLIIRIL